MSRQQEIRKVINSYVDDDCLYPKAACVHRSHKMPEYCTDSDGAYKCLMKRLTELGVVIKVECPKCHGIGIFYRGEPIENRCVRCKGTGYVAVAALLDD